MKQLSLIKEKAANEFGGALLVGRRKTFRPLSTKRPIHLVLRGDISKSGSLRRNVHSIEATLKKYASKFALKIYRLSINSNHCHLIIKIKRRDDFHNFSRSVTGVLSKAIKIKWLFRPFTRVINWGHDFAIACRYVLQNELEARWVIEYTPRGRKRAPKTDSS